LTAEERAMLASADHGHGHGHGHVAAMPVSGGSQEATHSAEGHGHDDHGHGGVWPDVTRKELITLLPLAALTIILGVYPKPVIDIMEPALQRIIAPFLS
jgi:hypothetical protein